MQLWAFGLLHRTNQSAGLFAAFAPLLYQYYDETMCTLCAKHSNLTRNFPNSVFGASTFNFGPATVTFPHTDAANLAWGWCSITALGSFNPDLGGHLVLWNMGLVIRFPPGSTILIPSALIRHSNTPIQQGEFRYSFTQYSAAGLFRWVENGFCSDKQSAREESLDARQEREVRRQTRWRRGLAMFSRLDEL